MFSIAQKKEILIKTECDRKKMLKQILCSLTIKIPINLLLSKNVISGHYFRVLLQTHIKIYIFLKERFM